MPAKKKKLMKFGICQYIQQEDVIVTSNYVMMTVKLHLEFKNEEYMHYCWFSHDVTKIQTTKLSILPRFYFHDALEQLKTNFHTRFHFKRVLGYVIECA